MTRDKMMDAIDMASSSMSQTTTTFRRRTMATTEMRELLANQKGCDPIDVLNVVSSKSRDFVIPATSSTTRRMSIGEPIIGAKPKEEVNDWEEERLDIEGFVMDYFMYKIRQNGSEWFGAPELPYGTQPEHEMMRSIAAIFEKRNHVKLELFAEQLTSSPKVTFSLYQEVVQTVGWDQNDPCQMNYGRLIGLIAFGGLVASQMQQKSELRDQIMNMARYTSLFIKSRLRSSWKQHGRSWSGFMELGTKMKQKYSREDEEIAMIARRRRRLSFFGISAVAALGFFVGGRFIFGGRT